MSLAGNYDRLTPSRGLDKIDQQLKAHYLELGTPEAWKLIRYNIGHFETADMRYEVKSFLEKWPKEKKVLLVNQTVKGRG